MGAKALADSETILVMDNFMQKTVANIRENPKAAIYVWGGEGVKGCFQVHGDVTYVNEGEQFEAFRKETLARMPNVPAKGMLVIKITDVYTCAAGPGAGDKIV
ncbi:pyridoxamine 5'-phosphate oxidase family protein [Methanogenium cariaci]|uniref:pyridoxamine 5'-phosphate oxidase family protein n=1 Tax=Methanogenium cariaci TaxID=2197 RepID=UPI001FDF87CE|nr:pyridoxamine 5'-phosphate oxidase family protein [Methanogenium cariaci]